MERLLTLRFGAFAASASLLQYLVWLCAATVRTASVRVTDLDRLAMGGVFIMGIGFAIAVASAMTCKWFSSCLSRS